MTLPFRNSLRGTFIATACLNPQEAVGERATLSNDVLAEEVTLTDSILTAPAEP